MQVTVEASFTEATTPWRQPPRTPRQAFPPLPFMDGVTGKVADSVADITKQVGEVSGHVEDWAGKGVDWAEQQGLKATEKIVATLEELLGTVEAAVDELLSRGMAERDQLQQALATQLTPEGDLTQSEMLMRRLLQKFSQSVNAFLNAAVGDFGFLANTVRSSGEALGKGLKAAGQKPLNDRLNATLSSSGLWLEDLKSQLTSMEGKLATGGIKTQAGLGSFLQSASRGVCSASEGISKFADLFQKGFRDVSDHLTDAVASRLPADMTAKIYEATSAIQHSVGSIVWKLKSAKRELVLGVNQGIADIANALKMQPSPVVACSVQLPLAVFDVSLEDAGARVFEKRSASTRAAQVSALLLAVLTLGLDALYF